MLLGNFLIEKGIVTQEQIDDILNEHKVTNQRIGEIVVSRGYASKDEMTQVLAEYFQIPYVKLKEVYKDIDPETIRCIPKDLAYRLKVIPINKKENDLFVALEDPLEIDKIDTLQVKTKMKIRPMIASPSDIMDALDYCYHGASQMKKQIENFIDLEAKKEDVQKPEKKEAGEMGVDDPPVVGYVKSLIIQAVNKNVSDILIQPKEYSTDFRFRIDGILYDQDAPPLEMLNAIISRIKILAGLNIAEKRIPQDGRFKIVVGERDVDVRVSSMPTIYGESIVMRLLNMSAFMLTLDDLGFEKSEANNYKEILKNSYGFILVTGPTGSGKTTTLYSSLNEIQDKTKHIITMEDPVEYRMSSVTQSQVDTKVGYSFADGLRSILRQSPDVILVGEIRDKVTAEIAIHSALTGHLVFSTLHTNDAASAPVRFVNMGVEPFLITSCLLGVIAQRLIRIICPECKEKQMLTDDVRKKLNVNGEIGEVYHGKGCDHCAQTGYKGREAIYELLVPNDRIREMILNRRSADEIKAEAVKNGMKTLRENAIKKLKKGSTTVEEVMRLTQETTGADS